MKIHQNANDFRGPPSKTEQKFGAPPYLHRTFSGPPPVVMLNILRAPPPTTGNYKHSPWLLNFLYRTKVFKVWKLFWVDYHYYKDKQNHKQTLLQSSPAWQDIISITCCICGLYSVINQYNDIGNYDLMALATSWVTIHFLYQNMLLYPWKECQGS